MKRSGFLVISLVFAEAIMAQSDAKGVMCSGSICMQYEVIDESDQPIAYDSASYRPAEFYYCGRGEEALQYYFEMNLTYPQDAITDKVSGTVYISFYVNKDGDVERVKVEKGVREDVDRASIRAVEGMNYWEAATLDYIPIATKFLLPLHFRFDSETEFQWRR